MCWNCRVHPPTPARCFLQGYNEEPTISQNRIKAISSAVIHQSDSVLLTTTMQMHAVHYAYDLWSPGPELQSHAIEFV